MLSSDPEFCLFSELSQDGGHTLRPAQEGGMFTCDFCPAAFNTKALCHRHMSQNHNVQLPYSCHVCGKGFTSLSGHEKHIKSAHVEKRFVCPICDNRFGRKDNLKYHMKNIHKLTICPYCSQTFGSTTDFNSHILACGRGPPPLPAPSELPPFGTVDYKLL